jgi:hypothetical protein
VKRSSPFAGVSSFESFRERRVDRVQARPQPGELRAVHAEITGRLDAEWSLSKYWCGSQAGDRAESDPTLQRTLVEPSLLGSRCDPVEPSLLGWCFDK